MPRLAPLPARGRPLCHRDRLADQLAVLRQIDGVAEHPLGGGDNEYIEARDELLAGPAALGRDLLTGSLHQALVLLLSIRATLLEGHICSLVGAVDDAAGLRPCLGEHLVALCEHALGLGAGVLGLLQCGTDSDPARLGHLLEGRQDPLGDDAEHDEEDDELDDKGAIRMRKFPPLAELDPAALANSIQQAFRRYFLARTKTNRTMKTRLMKYMASTSPTMMNMIVNNRPWASG